MNQVLFEILKAVIIVAIIATVRYIVPWIKSNTKLADNKLLAEIAASAVQYAEQTIEGGSAKKTAVMELLADELADYNIAITNDQLDALVESAVYALKQAKAEKE
jgi:LL-H family phage holin